MVTSATDTVRRPTTPRPVLTVNGGQALERPDRLVTEEPLEIRLAGPGQEARPVVVTMRTPGADFELAAGFLTTEGLVSPEELTSIRYCQLPEGEEQHYNIVTVRLDRPVDPALLPGRAPATSACGLCGKTTLDEVARHCDAVAPGPVVPWSVITSLPDRLREHQRLFDLTGGLHGAALVDASGQVLLVREDVGRHNAVDKVVGHAVLAGDLPLADRVLVVSGRIGFEIVQKAAVAGIPMIVAVSAPSSLAVDTARRVGMTVVGFLRGERGNVYCGPERVELDGRDRSDGGRPGISRR